MWDNIRCSDDSLTNTETSDGQAASRYRECWSEIKSNNLSDVQKALCKQFNDQGFLDLTINDPLLIAKVDATLDRVKGKLTITEVDGNNKHKSGDSIAVDVQSGNLEYSIPYGKGADGRYDNFPEKGPIPKGDYMIGNRYRNEEIARRHPGGDPYWYKLYGRDGKGGYSHEKIWNGRGLFSLHTGDHSNGCVSFPSKLKEPDPRYPYSPSYYQVKDLIDSSKPFEYKGTTFKGWLHVK